MAQLDEPPCQQSQAPACEARWGLATGQGNQMGLLLAIELALVTPLAGAAAQRGLEAFLDETLTETVDRDQADIQGVADLLIGPGRPIRGSIGLQQDTSV